MSHFIDWATYYPFVYSSTERRIGTYNGKPLYRRLFSGGITQNTANQESTIILWNSSPIDDIVDVHGWFGLGLAGFRYPATSGHPTRYGVISRSNTGDIRFTSMADFPRSSEPYSIALDYTKIT